MLISPEKRIYTLQIDKGFQGLIRPLYKNEYLLLEANLIKDGCREPISVWNGIIVDGHNRYKICTKHQIPFAIEEKYFSCREEAIAWICANQLGRRNLTEESRKYLIGKQYESEKIVCRKKAVYQSHDESDDLPYETYNPSQEIRVVETKRKTAQRIGEDIRNAKERRPGMMGFAEVMVIEYNGRKKNGSAHRLQLQKLYEKPKREKNSDVF